jgi:hypothetical protein
MSIKSLVKEYVRIEEAERKLHERKYALKDKINKTSRCIEIIDGVDLANWRYGVGTHGNYTITRVGEVNEKTL